MLNGNGKKKIIFDVDGTLLDTKGLEGGYAMIQPQYRVLDWIKEHNTDEFEFEAYTARGSKSKFNFEALTRNQLKGIPLTDIYFNKPDADWYVDDKGINTRNFNPKIEFKTYTPKHWGNGIFIG